MADPPVPMLSMIVDRSSFDETDDYGVDRDALEYSAWSREKPDDQLSPVVRNGKVRRRMRWRPKSMMKPKRRRPQVNVSSNASVASGNSKRSHISVHSLASTETQVKSNTAKARTTRFPLPRPKYPDSYDGGVATIGVDRGKSPIFHAADHDEQPVADTAAKRGSSTSSKKGLFRAPPRPPLPSRASRQDKSVGRTVQNTFQHQPSSSTSSTSSSLREPVVPVTTSKPMPSLPTEEVGRRVDLRMRTNSESSQDSSSSPIKKDPRLFQADNGDDSYKPMALEELTGEDETTSLSRRLFHMQDKDSEPVVHSSDSFGYHSEGEMNDDDAQPLSYLSEGEVDHAVVKKSYSSPLPDRNHNDNRSVVTPPGAAISVRDLIAQQQRQRREVLMYDPPYSPTLGLDKNDKSSPVLAVPQGETLVLGRGRKQRRRRGKIPGIGPSRSLPTKIGDNELPSQQSSSRRPEKIKDEIMGSSSRDQEIQFSMTPIEEDYPVTSASVQDGSQCPSFGNSKPHTGPVDVDEASFLEVEKNLEAIHDMATEHLQHGEYVEALEVFEEILRGQLARYGQDHYRVGTALHNIGIVHMKSGDYASAIKVCKEAVRVRKKALDPFHPDVADSLAQLGVAYMEEGKHKRSIAIFREALKIRRRCMGPRHPKVAKILNNIGCCLYELNEWEVSMVAFQEALEIQRDTLRRMAPESQESSDQQLLSIASTLSNIGSIKLYWGLHDEAAVSLEEVLLIQQSVLGDEHPVARRTQESVDWVEKARSSDEPIIPPTTSQNDDSFQGAGPLVCAPGQDVRYNLLEAALNRMHAGLDFACGAPDDRGANDDDDSEATGMVTV